MRTNRRVATRLQGATCNTATNLNDDDPVQGNCSGTRTDGAAGWELARRVRLQRAGSCAVTIAPSSAVAEVNSKR